MPLYGSGGKRVYTPNNPEGEFDPNYDVMAESRRSSDQMAQIALQQLRDNRQGLQDQGNYLRAQLQMNRDNLAYQQGRDTQEDKWRRYAAEQQLGLTRDQMTAEQSRWERSFGLQERAFETPQQRYERERAMVELGLQGQKDILETQLGPQRDLLAQQAKAAEDMLAFQRERALAAEGRQTRMDDATLADINRRGAVADLDVARAKREAERERLAAERAAATEPEMRRQLGQIAGDRAGQYLSRAGGDTGAALGLAQADAAAEVESLEKNFEAAYLALATSEDAGLFGGNVVTPDEMAVVQQAFDAYVIRAKAAGISPGVIRGNIQRILSSTENTVFHEPASRDYGASTRFRGFRGTLANSGLLD